MNVSLDPKLQQYVDDKVRAGEYESPDEVLNAAVSLMKDQEEWTPEDVAHLRQDIAHAIEQLDRGEGRPLDMDAIKARVIETARRQQRAG